MLTIWLRDNVSIILLLYFLLMLSICYWFEIMSLNTLNVKESNSAHTGDTNSYSLIKTVSLDKICSHYNRDELFSLVWSHRGRVSSHINMIDGSAEAISLLISSNIINFDIDVSFVKEHNNFYVIHPTLLNKVENINKYLSLREFLNIMHDSNNSRLINSKVKSFVTIEPKFNDINLYSKMIEIIVASNYVKNNYGNMGIIAYSKNSYKVLTHSLTHLEKSYKNIYIAIAFRSITNGHDDTFLWSGRNDIVSNIIPIAFMPDYKLLANDAANGKSSKKVISWTIDSIEEVYEALYHNVDGIISNTPIELLNSLQKDYDKFCAR